MGTHRGGVRADLAAGQMTLAVIPSGAHSRAAVRVAARSASLLVLYSAVPMWALTPLSEQMLTIARSPSPS